MIKQAGKEELRAIAEPAKMLWNSHTTEELTQEFSGILKKKNAAVFVKYHDGYAVGFAQCQLRFDYVEGTNSSPVGYLEGIFVKEEYRRQGYARQLVNQCEQWAKQQGCVEFASDCELTNQQSFAFHKRMNFEEANRIICFCKKI